MPKRHRFRSAITGLFVTASAALRFRKTTVREAVKKPDPRVMIAHHGTHPYRKIHPSALAGLAMRLIEAGDDLAQSMHGDAHDGQLHYDCDHLVSQTLPNGDLLMVTASIHRRHEAPGS